MNFFLIALLTLCGMSAFGQQAKLVVPPFEKRGTNLDAGALNNLQDYLINAFINTGRFQVPDRNALVLLEKENEFQVSDWSDEKKSAEMGKVLNADYIVRGIIMHDGEFNILTARILDVNTANGLSAAEMEFLTQREARGKMDDFVSGILQRISAFRPAPRPAAGRIPGGVPEGFTSATGYGQNSKPHLVVLPFSGGSGEDGDTIARWLQGDMAKQGTFTIVDRAHVERIMGELKYQREGLTDPNTVIDIGSQLHAEYIISGHIRRLGSQNLLIVSIINLTTQEQRDGMWEIYNKKEEILSLIPRIAQELSRNSGQKKDADQVAIQPFEIKGAAISAEDSETLAQILACELSNTGRVTVLPRTRDIEKSVAELKEQRNWQNPLGLIGALGMGINPRYLLAGTISQYGQQRLFELQLLRLDSWTVIDSWKKTYERIEDGLEHMKTLAEEITGIAAERQREEAEKAAEAKKKNDEAAEAQRIAEEENRLRLAETERRRKKFSSIGIALGSSFAAPWAIATVQGTLALLPYTFIELGCDAGAITGEPEMRLSDYWSVYPFAHLAVFLPLGAKGGVWFGAGGGYMLGNYHLTWEGEAADAAIQIMAIDATAGFLIGNFLILSYTWRSDFKTMNHKVSAGFVYRFKKADNR